MADWYGGGGGANFSHPKNEDFMNDDDDHDDDVNNMEHEISEWLKFKNETNALNIDEDVGSTGKSMWDETYSNPVQVPIGLVTRACAKKFKDVLIGLIQATWSQAIAWRPIEGITSDNQPNKCVIQVLEETE
ncbi:hypothetical protein TIFTF001_031627 [Ficus carica]|uniref:Uncharacterized protein n=1 Tax=Ficus carica TaxID=3494 RepID=A0AA88DV30_FICCA|nr:hypothetical protein TIFTF001_031627 [Ficus carica]